MKPTQTKTEENLFQGLGVTKDQAREALHQWSDTRRQQEQFSQKASQQESATVDRRPVASVTVETETVSVTPKSVGQQTPVSDPPSSDASLPVNTFIVVVDGLGEYWSIPGEKIGDV